VHAFSVRQFREGDEESIAHIHNEGFKEWIESLTIYYGYCHIHSDDVKNWRGKDGLFLAEMDSQPVGYVHFVF